MDFSGRYRIPAPPETVWVALHDPDVLAQAVPGCEAMEKLSETDFKARVAIKIGPVSARFEGKVSVMPKLPAAGFSHALTLTGEGQGDAAGFARGKADVRLAPQDGGTILVYDATTMIGGRLAQLGQRLIDGTAKSLADAFFAKFAALLQGEAPPASEPPKPDTDGLGPQIWVVGLIGIVILLLILFGIVL